MKFLKTKFVEFLNENTNYSPNFEVDDIVQIHPSNDNDSYDDFRNKDLRIVNVSNNTTQHPLYDSSMDGQGLYDLKVEETGEDVPFSLYDYELVEI